MRTEIFIPRQEWNRTKFLDQMKHFRYEIWMCNDPPLLEQNTWPTVSALYLSVIDYSMQFSSTSVLGKPMAVWNCKRYEEVKTTPKVKPKPHQWFAKQPLATAIHTNAFKWLFLLLMYFLIAISLMYYLAIVNRSGLRAFAKCLNCKLWVVASSCMLQGESLVWFRLHAKVPYYFI